MSVTKRSQRLTDLPQANALSTDLCTTHRLTNSLLLKNALREEKNGIKWGKIPEWQTHPSPPPIWKHKNGLFCILGPKENYSHPRCAFSHLVFKLISYHHQICKNFDISGAIWRWLCPSVTKWSQIGRSLGWCFSNFTPWANDKEQRPKGHQLEVWALRVVTLLVHAQVEKMGAKFEVWVFFSSHTGCFF